MAKQKIIDAHVHMDAWDKKTKNYVKNSGVEQFWVMDTHYENSDNPVHVKKEVILKAAKEMPKTIIPFAKINWNEKADQVEKNYKSGFVGLKAICPPKAYNDPQYYPIYEAANHFNMPILFHTGIIGHSTDCKKQPQIRGYGPDNMQPAHLATIADLFPEMTIIGGHPGYPYTEQTEHNLYYYPNIYHDISGYLPLEWFLKVLDKRTCSYLKGPELFCDKFIFATDCCLGNKESENFGTEKRMATELFFSIFCRKYRWYDHVDHILYKNAKKLMQKVLKSQKRSPSLTAVD
jgi:predicted TIM-barrel fold metal-dependent hydrolase